MIAHPVQLAPLIYHARQFAPCHRPIRWDGAGQQQCFGLWQVRHGTVSFHRAGRIRHLRPGSCGISEPGMEARLGPDSQGQLVVFDLLPRRRRPRRQGGACLLRDGDTPQPPWEACFTSPLPLPVAADWYHETALLCDRLRHDYWRSTAALRTCNAQLHLWLSRYVQAHEQAAPDPPARDLADRVEAVIYQSSHARLSVAELARLVGAAPSTVHRAYRARFGHGPRRGLELRRIERAMHYLRENALGIDAIAHEVGYTDHASFTRAFRRCTGCSPSVWRQRASL